MQQREQALEYKDKFLESSYQEEKFTGVFSMFIP